MDDKKIAVLIDAENVSGKYIKLILDEVSNYGSATYKRLYGDFQTPSVRAWMKNLRDYAITPVFQYNYTQGKNASDSALIIERWIFYIRAMWMASVSSPRTVILRSWCCACVSQA